MELFKNKTTKAIDWCSSLLGTTKVLSDHSKVHGGHESSIYRIHTATGHYYLKLHESKAHWGNEVHAYEHWTQAFGNLAPRLIAVNDKDPFALIVSVVSGQIVEGMQLSPSKEQGIWKSAGAALAKLHNLVSDQHFGPCLRDGGASKNGTRNAKKYVSERFRQQIEQAVHGSYINDYEHSVIEDVYNFVSAFEDERPVPCHRDYCAANWLVTKEGVLTGVIDFEFAYLDVRVADFSRDPNWNWIDRPDLIKSFFEGYGRLLTSKEEKQLLVAHTEYALSAILWGRDNSFFGFEQEGRKSLVHIASLL